MINIKILHCKGFDQPIDPCEIECLQEMELRLKELGARKRNWDVANHKQ